MSQQLFQRIDMDLILSTDQLATLMEQIDGLQPKAGVLEAFLLQLSADPPPKGGSLHNMGRELLMGCRESDEVADIVMIQGEGLGLATSAGVCLTIRWCRQERCLIHLCVTGNPAVAQAMVRLLAVIDGDGKIIMADERKMVVRDALRLAVAA